jgi:hypothetical protein
VTIALEFLLASPTSPGFYPHSEWAALGPVQFGSDFKPGSITVVMNPGCWGAAIYRTISKDRPVFRNHPNKAVDVDANIPPGSRLSFSSD